MVTWLYLGKKIIKINANLGFVFLAIYICFSTYSCMMQIEDNQYRPGVNFDSTEFFDKNRNKNYQFSVVEYKGKEYIRVRPWSENFVIFATYNFYRLFLLHSYIPEYIFDFKGNLVGWTNDSYDDPKYQNSWGRAKEIREISKEEYKSIIN